MIVYPKYEPKYGEKIHDFGNGFEVYEWYGRFYMVKNGLEVAMTFRSTFEGQYKGDFDKWMSKVIKQGKSRIKSTRERIKWLIAEVKELNDVWGDKRDGVKYDVDNPIGPC